MAVRDGVDTRWLFQGQGPGLVPSLGPVVLKWVLVDVLGEESNVMFPLRLRAARESGLSLRFSS